MHSLYPKGIYCDSRIRIAFWVTHETHPIRSNTLEAHLALTLGTLHPEGNINAPMQLIHLAANPRNLLRKVDLVAENFTSLRRRAQCVQGTADHARRGFLVIENAEHGGSNGHHEDGEGLQPALAGVDGGQFAVCAALHEWPRIGAWGGDDRAARSDLSDAGEPDEASSPGKGPGKKHCELGGEDILIAEGPEKEMREL